MTIDDQNLIDLGQVREAGADAPISEVGRIAREFAAWLAASFDDNGEALGELEDLADRFARGDPAPVDDPFTGDRQHVSG